MLQTKEQDKFPETDVNEMEMRDLPGRVQKSPRSGEQCMNKVRSSAKG